MIKQEPFNNVTTNIIDVEQALINICNVAKAKYYELYQRTKHSKNNGKL
jgi:hypothetical protein